MTLTLRPVPGKEKSYLICKAFAAGAPKNAEGDVFFGTEGQMSAWRQAQARAAAGGAPFYYVDNAYFDKARGSYFRVTRNALQVDPRGKEPDLERFAKLGVKIREWREPGPNVLLTPQSDNFMKSTLGLVGYDWADATAATLRAWGVTGVRIRPWNRDKIKAGVALLEDLKSLRLLITFSSASAITAMLEGVPSISASDTAAAFHLTGPLTRESVIDPPRPSYEDRLRFAGVLAGNQFTLDEFRDGTAWRKLNS